ncbi:YopX family protein [uncultured Campylobacter sp.]|uniref:YopX family protein n=1 Tax=uncultured Campylobacter sp. TaxID=218934 RepID=UPI00260A514E|nr:YopX family protein [uncultured Campylobacter sp.]
MRKIKFRAFFKMDERIYEVTSIDFANKEVTLWDKETAVDFEASFEDIELLQYTGINDINGKEIYTGFLVKWGLRTYQICFDCGFYMHDLSRINPEYPITKEFKNASDEFEVIGNIYGSAKISKDTK